MNHGPISYDVPGGKALDCMVTKDLQIDERKASAVGILASSSKDRGGDIVEIKGIQLEAHKKNPVVSWLHFMAWGSEDGIMPIGVAETPEGKYTVKLLPDEGIATCETFFNQKTLLSTQICALVMSRDIRAMSIGYRELAVDRMYEDDKYIGTLLKEIELLEAAWVHLPMNSDCARSILGKQIGGKALHPSIEKSLYPYVGVLPSWSNGVTLSMHKGIIGADIVPEVPMTADEIKQFTDLQKTVIELKTVIDGLKAQLPAPKKKADDKPPEEGAERDEPDTAEKHGSKACRKCYKAAMAGHKACMKAAAPLDDGETKSLLEEHGDAMKNAAEEIKAHHGKTYKDEEPIAEEKDESSDADRTAADDEQKSLEYAQRRHLQALKHQRRLAEING
jgi:hypothetical protein